MQRKSIELKSSTSEVEFGPKIDDKLMKQVEDRIDEKCEEFVEFLNGIPGEKLEDFDKETIKKHFSIDLLLRVNAINSNRKKGLEEDVLSKGLYSLEAFASTQRKPLRRNSEQLNLAIPQELTTGEYIFKDIIDLPSTKAFIDYLKKSPTVTLPSYLSKNPKKIERTKPQWTR